MNMDVKQKTIQNCFKKAYFISGYINKNKTKICLAQLKEQETFIETKFKMIIKLRQDFQKM